MRPGVSVWGWRALLSLVVITAPNPGVLPWSSLDFSASGHTVELQLLRQTRRGLWGHAAVLGPPPPAAGSGVAHTANIQRLPGASCCCQEACGRPGPTDSNPGLVLQEDRCLVVRTTNILHFQGTAGGGGVRTEPRRVHQQNPPLGARAGLTPRPHWRSGCPQVEPHPDGTLGLNLPMNQSLLGGRRCPHCGLGAIPHLGAPHPALLLWE